MRNFNTLIGLSVKVYLDNHTVEGVLESLDDEKIILNAKGSFILIYKNKINMVILNWNDNSQDPLEEINNNEEEELEAEELFLQNGIAENNQYGSIRPGILLEQQPMDPIEKLIDLDLKVEVRDDDFSINASTLYNEEGLLSRAEREKIKEEAKRNFINGSEE